MIDQDLLDDLEGPGPLTVFAPTNQAFNILNLPPDTDPAVVNAVLLYHVVGELIDPIIDGASYTTLNGAAITTTNTNSELKVEESDIVDSISASNGIIHVINAVLIPPTAPAPAPTPNNGARSGNTVRIESLSLWYWSVALCEAHFLPPVRRHSSFLSSALAMLVPTLPSSTLSWTFRD